MTGAIAPPFLFKEDNTLEPIGLSKIRYHSTTGVLLEITPITLLIHSQLAEWGAKEYPAPDPSPFERPIPDALTEGTKTSASDDPEYIALLDDVRAKRRLFVQNRVLENFVTSPNRSDLLNEYAEQIINARGMFFSGGESDWLVLLLGFLLNPQDVTAVTLAALQRLPIDESEVSDGYKFFRLGIQRAVVPGIPEGQGSSNTEAT